MKVALTGATGYLGGHIAARLIARGHQVEPLTRVVKGPSRFELESEVTPNLTGVDVLVHAAWDFSARNEATNRRINIAGSQRLLEAAKRAGVRKLVFVSTMSAFAGCHSCYGRSKLVVEELFLQANGRVLRPGLIWGDQAGGIVGILDRIVRRQFAPVITGGRPLYLAHVEDVADLAVGIAEAPGRFAPIMIAAHRQGFRMAEIMVRRARAQGRRPLLFPIPWPLAWLGARVLEALVPHSTVRSDSVIGLAYAVQTPQFEAEAHPMRPFT